MKSHVRRAIERAAFVSLSTVSVGWIGSLVACSDTSGAASTGPAADAGHESAVDSGDATASEVATGMDASAPPVTSIEEDGAPVAPPLPASDCTGLLPIERDAASSETSCYVVFPVTGDAGTCQAGMADFSVDECVRLCPTGGADAGVPAIDCWVAGGDDGGLDLGCVYMQCGGSGRRPDGFALAPTALDCEHPIGQFLAAAWALEAASVVAFRTMARELASVGAPRRMTRQARRSAREEVRHTRSMKRLAKRAGRADHEVAGAVVPPATPRSIEAMARENAVEGCVRETYGAALAELQAARAVDPEVRRTLRIIARDEARHAELSWRAARWLNEQLDTEARARVQTARQSAIAQLEAEVSVSPDARLAEALGLPLPHEAKAILASLNASLWNRAGLSH